MNFEPIPTPIEALVAIEDALLLVRDEIMFLRGELNQAREERRARWREEDDRRV